LRALESASELLRIILELSFETIVSNNSFKQ